METSNKTEITVEVIIKANVEKVWNFWTLPEHITKWNNASEDWHTPYAKNDLRIGGKFLSRMEAKDGSVGFDFTGTYDEIITNKKIVYKIIDGRVVNILFTSNGNETKITESFEAETLHSHEIQKTGWQSILDNFKKYVERIQ